MHRPVGTLGRVVGRAFRWTERHPDRAVLLALGVATVFRLVYVARIGNHLAGPDALTYDTAAREFVRHGLLWPHVAGLPEWSPGYPLLLALHYAVVGRHPFTVALTQTAMIAGLTWLTYRLDSVRYGLVVVRTMGHARLTPTPRRSRPMSCERLG